MGSRSTFQGDRNSDSTKISELKKIPCNSSTERWSNRNVHNIVRIPRLIQIRLGGPVLIIERWFPIFNYYFNINFCFYFHAFNFVLPIILTWFLENSSKFFLLKFVKISKMGNRNCRNRDIISPQNIWDAETSK